MKKQTVHQLRKSGWKVKVGHKRIFYRFCPKTGKKQTKICLAKFWSECCPDFFLSPKGGYTEVSITSPEGETHTDTAVCNISDYYNNKMGLEIALGRTLSHFKNV